MSGSDVRARYVRSGAVAGRCGAPYGITSTGALNCGRLGERLERVGTRDENDVGQREFLVFSRGFFGAVVVSDQRRSPSRLRAPLPRAR